MGFFSLLLIIFGLLMLIRPTIIWTITERWKSHDATEPSGIYVVSARFGGILVTLAGIGGVLGYWIL